MKFLTFLILTISSSLSAQSSASSSATSSTTNDTSVDDLLKLSDRVQSKISLDAWSMTADKREQITRRLRAVERILDGEDTSAVACIKHSNSYLGYALTRISTNQKISTSMSISECRSLLNTQKNNIICTKTSQAFLGYKPYNLTNSLLYGVSTDFNECSLLTRSNNRGLLCVKLNISYNGYAIARLVDGGLLGGFYNRVECLSQL